MALHDYTTSDDVRAALGVSSEELEEATLGLETIGTQLDMSLEDLSPDLADSYATVHAIQQHQRTEAQQRFYLYTRTYATYVVANLLLNTLAMFSFKRLTDGKAEAERTDAWEDTKKDVRDNLELLRRRLQTAFTNLNTVYVAPAPTRMNFIVASGLLTNPVTGE